MKTENIELGRVIMGNLQKKLTSSQIIILGFAAVILLGTILLTLPFATWDEKGAVC